MEALVELIAKYLGLASDFVTANFDKYYNQLVSMKISCYTLWLVIGVLLLIVGIVLIIKATKTESYDKAILASIGITVIITGLIPTVIAIYYLICWTKAPDIMLVNWLLENLK